MLTFTMAPILRECMNGQFLLGAQPGFTTEYESLQMEPQVDARYSDYLA